MNADELINEHVRKNYINEMRQFRDKVGLTQVQLAKKLKISTSTVVSIEADRLKISPKMRLRMGAFMGADKATFIERMVAEYRRKLEREFI